MPKYEITAPDGRRFEITAPDGASEDQVLAYAKANYSSVPAPKKESSFFGEMGRSLEQTGSQIRSGLGSIVTPNESAQAGVQRAEDIQKRYGEGPSLEAVKKAYAEKGLLPAAYEVASQIPQALAGQTGTIGTVIAGGKAGAALGARMGLKGEIIGGALGAGAAMLPQFAGANVEAQAQEQMEQGKPVDINRTKAYGTALGQAALEGISYPLAFGKKLVKGVLGIAEDAGLKTAKAEADLLKAAQRSAMGAAATGAARAVATDIPVEVGQQILQRWQAGKSLTSPDALKEYGESAYLAGLVGTPLGGLAGRHGRNQAVQQVAFNQAEEQAAQQAAADAKGPQLQPGEPGMQGTLFGELPKAPKPEQNFPRTDYEFSRELEQLKTQPPTTDNQARIAELESRLKPASKETQQGEQLGLGLEANREYADIVKERERLKRMPRTPEIKARIEELDLALKGHDLHAIDTAHAEQIENQTAAEEYPNLAALNPTPNPRGQGELFGPEEAPPSTGLPSGAPISQLPPTQAEAGVEQAPKGAYQYRLAPRKGQKPAVQPELTGQGELFSPKEAPPSTGLPLGAPISQLPPTQAELGTEQAPKGAYQYKLAARKNPKIAPLSTPETTAAEPIAATQPITTDDIKRTGVPLRSTLPWFTTNVVGKTQPQVQELVSKQPDLVKGQDPRAQILRAILAAPIPTFQEAQNVQPASTTQPTTEPRLEPRGGEPSLGVSEQPTNAVPAGTRRTLSLPPKQPKKPVGRGLVPTGQPATEGTAPETTQQGTLNAPPATLALPAPTSKENKAPPTPTNATPVKTDMFGQLATYGEKPAEEKKPAKAETKEEAPQTDEQGRTLAKWQHEDDTSPFNWRGKPSLHSAELQKEHDKETRKELGHEPFTIDGTDLVREVTPQDIALLEGPVEDLSEAQLNKLENHYDAARDTKEFWQKLNDDVTRFATKGAKAVASAIRNIIKQINAGLLSVAMIFNPTYVSPPEAYVVTNTATVTYEKEVLQELPQGAEKMSPAGKEAFSILMPALQEQLSKSDKLLIMADKPSGRVFVFTPDGKLVIQKKTLFGLAKGDFYKGNNDLPSNRITPAGLHNIVLVDAAKGGAAAKTAGEYDFGKVFGIKDKNPGVLTIMHSVWLHESDAAKRAQALQNESAEDSRYSFGCINVDKTTYKYLLDNYEQQMDGAKLFIVPDNQARIRDFVSGEVAQNKTGEDKLLREAVKPVTKTVTEEVPTTGKPSTETRQQYAKEEGLPPTKEGRTSVTEGQGQSLDSLKQEIASGKGILANALRRMLASGKVKLEATHPDGNVGGYYDGKIVTLYAQGIKSGEAMAVALHEVGVHMGLERMLGKDNYRAIAEQIGRLAGSKVNSPERELAQRAIGRIPKEDIARNDPKVMQDETIAYFIEELVKAENTGKLPKMGPLRVTWNRIKAAITAAINRVFGTNLGMNDLSPRDIASFAEAAFTRESRSGIREHGEGRLSTTSSAFQRWFGNSKVVDDSGKPLVVYHGTTQDISKFKMSPDGALGAGIYLTPSTEYAGQYAPSDTTGSNVMPLYASIKNPLTIDGSIRDPMIEALVRLGVQENKATSIVEKAYEEKGYIGKQVMTRAQAQGYDGIMQYDRDGNLSEIVAFSPNQIKSVFNQGQYDRTNPDIRFSVSASTESLVDSMGKLDAEEKNILTRLVDGFKDTKGVDNVTKFRTKHVDIAATIESRLANKFNGAVRDALGNINPMGLFRQAQDYTKLLLDYFQRGAIEKDPVTGLWKVTSKSNIRPPADVYKEIKAWGTKNGYSFERATQLASRILEGVRLDEMRKSNKTNGTAFLLHLKDPEIDQLVAEYKAQPELQAISKLMDDARIALVDHMIQVGRLTADEGKAWKEVIGYVPFDRIDDFAEKFNKVKRISGKGIAQVGKLPELIGSEKRPVGNVFDNYMNTLGWMIGQVTKTDATINTLKNLEAIGQAKPLGVSAGGRDNTVYGYVNGEMRYWELPSKYDVMAFKDLNPPKMWILRALGAFSNILRTAVTALPPFALKQVTDDVQRAILTSGVKNPAGLLWSSLTNFPKLALAELMGVQHPMVKELSEFGIVGQYDFVNGKPAASLLADMGYKPRGFVKGLLHKLEGITRASDLAVRVAIYKHTLKENNNDVLLAQTRAREFINFRRRGSSEFTNAMVTTVPFFNAYVQGMDVLYRSASGIDSSSSVGRAQARALFWNRAAAVTTFSLMYAMGKSDDDDYNEMDLRTRDNNWIFGNGVKLSVPGEIGAIFKVIPERVVEYMRRHGTPEEQEANEAVRTTFANMYEQYVGRVTPVPQALKPVLEAVTNYSFLTGRQLEGIHQKGMLPSMRTNETTSELALAIAKYAKATVGAEISPIMIDNSLRGYLGSTAALTTMVTDSLLNPTRTDRPLHKWLLFSNYMYDPVGTRRMGEFYETREKVGQLHNSLTELAKVDVNAAIAFQEKHADQLMLNSYVNSTLQQLENTRAYRKFLNSPDGAQSMGNEERNKELAEIKKYEIEIVRWLREAKADIARQ